MSFFSEKKNENDFPKDNSKWLIFSIRFVHTATHSSPQCLAAYSPDWSVDKSRKITNLVCKFMPKIQNLVVSTCVSFLNFIKCIVW